MLIKVLVCPGCNDRAADLLAGLLRDHPDLEVDRCTGCSTRHEAGTPHAVLVVGGWPHHDHLWQVTAARQIHPSAYVVVLGALDDSFHRRRFIEAGADEYLPLRDSVPCLLQAIRERRPRAASVDMVTQL